jgi:hypothetical protein
MSQNKSKRDEAVKLLEDFDEVTLVFSNDDECTIGNADNYLGGGDGYISEYLGNILYMTAEGAVDATIESMKSNGAELVDWRE